MPRDIVVMGASAGGVEALTKLVRKLPANFPAAVFITHHFPSGSRSVLPQILDRVGPLDVAHAQDGEPITGGTITVAPPDFHLTFRDGRMSLSLAAKENGHRPSIDTMFRSAARTFGPRVVGVILTGMLDDGVAGLLAIKARGRMAIVQDPDDASSSAMPSNAIKRVDVDRIARIEDMAQAIMDAVCGGEEAEAPAIDDRTGQLIGEEMRIDSPAPTIEGPKTCPAS